MILNSVYNLVIDSVEYYYSVVRHLPIVFKLLIVLLVVGIFSLFRKKFGRIIAKIVCAIIRKFRREENGEVLLKVEPPSRFLFLIIGLWVAINLIVIEGFWYDTLSHLVRTLVIFSCVWFLLQCAELVSEYLHEKLSNSDSKLSDMMTLMMKNGLKVLVLITGITIIIQEWGYNIGALLTGLGLGGLAFALAAKDTLANLIGSVMIMLDRPFSIGDWIAVANVEGTVEDIGFRSTRVRTFGQALVSIPNAYLTNQPIINWSKMGKRRVNFKLRIKIGISSEEIKSIIARIQNLLTDREGIHQDSITVAFDLLGEGGIELVINFYTETVDGTEYTKVKQEFNLELMDILREVQLETVSTVKTVI